MATTASSAERLPSKTDPRSAQHPRLGVGEDLGLQGVHHRGKGVLHELAVLELGPGLAVYLLGLLQERFVQPLELELELVLGHEVGGRAVAETVLHLPHHHRVNVLVVPGLAAHVEHDGDGLDAVHETSPGKVELGRIGGTVLREQGVGQGGAIGQGAAIEG